jgi:hypothetical protein
MNTASYAAALGDALAANGGELKDDNFVNPDFVLVFTEKTGELEEVALIDLPLLFPLAQPGMRWAYSDLGQLVEAKATLYRQSVVANELAEEDPTANPGCGTVCVVDPVRPGPLYWCRITGTITAPGKPGHHRPL